MRRCKKHNTDLSSLIGICASCLRDRLFNVILAQEQAQAQSETKPAIPISASPYINRRKSDTSIASVAPAVVRPYNKPRLNHSLSDQRFINSPQIAINTGGCIGSSSSSSSNSKTKKNRNSLIRFSSFSNLFKSKSGNGNGNEDANSTSNSNGVERKICVRDRGMSPVRLSIDGKEDELSSEYESCKHTPQKTPNRRGGGGSGGGGGGNRSGSEFIFCLSPLVRASPNRLWSMKGKPPAATVDGDEIRNPMVPYLSYTKSFYANRSRKLADFGRPDLNR